MKSFKNLLAAVQSSLQNVNIVNLGGGGKLDNLASEFIRRTHRTSVAAKKRRSRSCRIEELENREMLSVESAVAAMFADVEQPEFPPFVETAPIQVIGYNDIANDVANDVDSVPGSNIDGALKITRDANGTASTTQTLNNNGVHMYKMVIGQADVGKVLHLEVTSDDYFDVWLRLFNEDGEDMDYTVNLWTWGSHSVSISLDDAGTYYLGVSSDYFGTYYDPTEENVGDAEEGTQTYTITVKTIARNANDAAKVSTQGLEDYADWEIVGNELRLVSLYASWEGLTGALDLSGCTALEYVGVGGNELTSLKLSGCTALETLYAYGNELTSLDLTGCTALEYVYVDGNELTSLNLSGCTALEYVDVDGNKLKFSTVTLPSAHWQGYIYYGEQDEVAVTLGAGNTVDLSSEWLDGTTTFTWYDAFKTGQPLIANVDYTVADGVFTFNVTNTIVYAEMTNRGFSGLTLWTDDLVIGTPVEADPPGNSIAEAKEGDKAAASSVALENKSYAVVHTINDGGVHMYKLDVEAGKTYTISTSINDVYLRMFNEAGKAVSSNGTPEPDTPDPENPFNAWGGWSWWPQTFTAAASGTYYLGVSSSDAAYNPTVANAGDAEDGTTRYALKVEGRFATYTAEKSYPAVKGLKNNSKASTIDSITLTWSLDKKQLDASSDGLKIEVFSPTNNVVPIGTATLDIIEKDGKYTLVIVEVAGIDESAVTFGEVTYKSDRPTFTVTISGLWANTKYTVLAQATNDKTGKASGFTKITAATKKWSAVKIQKTSGAGSVTLTWTNTTAAPAGTIYEIGVFDAKGNRITWAESQYFGFTAAAGHENTTSGEDFWMWTKKDGWEWSYGVETTGTSITITGLAAQKYTFFVRAVNWDTDNESIVAKTSAAPAKTDAVKKLKAAKNDSKQGTITLTWDAVPGATRYDIEVIDSFGESYEADFLNDAGTAWYDGKDNKVLITGLLTQKYTFNVQAITEKNLGTEADPDWVVETRSAVAKTSGTPAGLGAAVKNLKATVKTGDAGMVSVDLNWDAVADAEGYTIVVLKGKEYVTDYWVSSAGEQAPPTTRAINNLEAGTKYTFIVLAEKQVKVGTERDWASEDPNAVKDRMAYASTAIAKTNASTAKFDAVKGFKSGDVTHDSVTLSWDAVSGAENYRIRVFLGKERIATFWADFPAASEANPNPAPLTTKTITDLDAGTKYTFEIQARKIVTERVGEGEDAWDRTLGTAYSSISKTSASTQKWGNVRLTATPTQDTLTIDLPAINAGDWSTNHPFPASETYNYRYTYRYAVEVVVGKNEPEWMGDYYIIDGNKAIISDLKPGTKYTFVVTTDAWIEFQAKDSAADAPWYNHSWIGEGPEVKVSASTQKLS